LRLTLRRAADLDRNVFVCHTAKLPTAPRCATSEMGQSWSRGSHISQ
jgi:hypothetical protein